MSKAIIKLTYKQVIDASSTGDFEKNVRFASYQEFLLKSQAYNPEGKFKTFDEMKSNDGRANSLHYKLSFAIGHFIEGLKGKIPGFADNVGNGITFDTPRFELIASDIININAHKVAIHYTTGDFTLLNSFGEHLVIAPGMVPELTESETFTIRMQDNLSIVNYRTVIHHPAIINN